MFSLPEYFYDDYTPLPKYTLMSGFESSSEQTVKYREECRTILALSPKIRYVGIINRFGRTLAGQLRRGIVPFFKREEARNEFFIESIRNQLRKSFESSIGKTAYSLTETEKVKIITITNEDKSYYITLDKDTSEEELSITIKSIKHIIES
jgi:hypothetical protein